TNHRPRSFGVARRSFGSLRSRNASVAARSSGSRPERNLNPSRSSPVGAISFAALSFVMEISSRFKRYHIDRLHPLGYKTLCNRIKQLRISFGGILMDFENRRVIVVGAGSGIGRAVALAASKAGATLILAGRTRETLEATAALLDGPSDVRVLDA